ncbi:MAG: aminotransferase class V-fold PLP-dependent enzyme, partial [Syntrophaceae bacterium]|nr:aminotransferase class V-fold PLP-dependent enzyme [Syntrophaceae bacterium]
LVSVMHVNNETGIIQPIDEICEVLKSHPAYFHSDSAQGFGKELKQPRNKRIDLLSCSGHKICGPKGIGALITRRRNYKRPPIKPLMFGGGQEASLRPGTQPVFLAAGLGFAAQLAFDEIEKRTAHCQKIGDNLIQMFTEYGFQVIGDDRRIPNIVLLAKEGLDSESLMITLKECVAISNGAACSSNNYTKSYVLSAMCIEDDISASVTRWSWGYHTKDESFTRLRTLLNDYLR